MSACPATSHFKGFTLVACLALSFCAAFADPPENHGRPDRPPSDALLNINFGDGNPWSGVAATGDGPADYWNPYYAPGESSAALPELLWSNGELSGASATVANAPGSWFNGHPDGMMNTFIHSFSGQPIIVTLSDLPNGTYDVYVYAHGGYPDDQNSVVSAVADGVTYGPEATTTDSSWLSSAWIEGAQYVLLQGVSVRAGSPLEIRAATGAIPQASVNGLQLRRVSKHAKKPHPSLVRPPANALLNLDVASTAPWSGPAATGDGPADYWNISYTPDQYFVELFDLKWSNGQASDVTATIENAPGSWFNGHPDGMMNTFIHSYFSQPITITFSDLPNGTYDVYVYAHGGYPDDQNSIVTAEVDGMAYGPEATTTDSSWLSSTWIEGAQYVLLEEVSVPAGSQLTIQAASDAIPQASLNGIQLRQVSKHAKKPHPSLVRPPEDALLNLDVGSTTPWSGPAATGDGPDDYWNVSYTPNQYFAELFNLKWSNGQASDVTATIENAPGSWFNGHPDGMMNTFIHSYFNEPVVITFTDLPNGTYDVYVYAHGGYPDDQNSIVTAEADGTIYGPEATTTGSGWLSPTWMEGAQYVLLEDVSVQGGSALVVRASADAISQASVNGIQLRRTSKHARNVKPDRIPKPPRDALLNMDLGSAAPRAGLAATGNGPTDYWNFSYAPNQHFVEVFNLKWSTGEETGAQATVENAPGLWTNGHPDPMMNTFIHSYAGLPVLITVSDLPRGTYDVYVYAHGGYPDTQNSVVSVEADGVVYGPETTTTDSSWLSPTWIEGAQYVLLSGVSLRAGSPLVIRADPGTAEYFEYAFVNGFQIRRTANHH